MPLLSLLLSMSLAHALPADRAGDAVLTALAEERAAAATRLIRSALSRARDDAERADLLCLLGTAQQRAGDLDGAVRTWREVPAEADCHAGATFDLADVLEQQGDVGQAAQLYELMGLPRTLPGRHDRTLALLRELMQATEDATGGPKDPRIGHLHSIALGLDLTPEVKREVALDTFTWMTKADLYSRSLVYRDTRIALLDAINAAGDDLTGLDDVRLAAANLMEGQEALALIAGLDEASVDYLLAKEALLKNDRKPSAAHLAREARLALRPESVTLRYAHANGLSHSWMWATARPHLEQLVDTKKSSPALQKLAFIARTAGTSLTEARTEEAKWLEMWLDRHPTHKDRETVERDYAGALRILARAHARDGDHAAAISTYDTLLEAFPQHNEAGTYAWEAAECARRSGNSEEAVRRWERLLGDGSVQYRALSSLADLRAEDDPEAALGWLEGLGRSKDAIAPLAASLRQERLSPGIHLQAGPAFEDDLAPLVVEDGTVNATVQNIDQLEVRVHRIDAEAFFRAGGTTRTLAKLDVGVIAPDAERTVAVPKAGRGVQVSLPIPLEERQPGFYAVTATAQTEQAQVVVRKSSTRMVARAAAGKLVVGVVNGTTPERGARVLVEVRDRILEGRTGADGLAWFETEEGGSARVLGLGRGGPAMMSVPLSRPSIYGKRDWTLETDRPFVVPGEPVRLRLQGRSVEGPLEGPVRVRLNVGGSAGPAQTVQLSPLGTAELTLAVPDTTDHPVAVVEVLELDSDDASNVGALQFVSPASPTDRRIIGEPTEDGGLIVTAVDGSGARVAGHPYVASHSLNVDITGITDDTGAAHLAPTAVGSAGRWRVVHPHAEPRRVLPVPRGFFDVQTRTDASGQVTARIEGPPGPITVITAFENIDHDRAPALRSPRELAESELERRGGFVDEDKRRPTFTDSLATPVREHHTIPASGTLELTLSADDTRRKVLRVISNDGLAGAVVQTIAPTALPRLDAPLRWTPGTTVALDTHIPTLVTLETAHRLEAHWVTGPGQPLPLPPGDQVRVAWTDITRQHGFISRKVDTALEVDATVTRADDKWHVRVQVHDADGNPAKAEVALRAVDVHIDQDARDHDFGDDWGALREFYDDLYRCFGGWGGPFRHTRQGERIEGALLVEAQREVEAERSRRAAAGALEGGAGAALMEDVVIGTIEGDPIITSGSGGGRSGYGSGGGTFHQKEVVHRPSSTVTLGPGPLDSGIWTVEHTDTRGILEVTLDAPPAGDWWLDARAITPSSSGAERVAVHTDNTPRIALPALAPGLPGEQVTAVAKVVNPTDEQQALRLGDQDVSVPARGTAEVALAPLTPGQQQALELRDGNGTLLDTATLAFDVAPASVPSESGPLVRVSVDPGGGPPLAHWLAADLDQSNPSAGAIARTGRLALAMHRRSPDDTPLAVVLQQLQHLRIAPPARSAEDAASVVAFLAEVAPLTRGARSSDRPIPAVADTEVDAAIQQLDALVSSAADRLTAQWARVVAGKEPDGTTLARAQRNADRLPPPVRARLADILRRQGDDTAARALLDGRSPMAAAVASALGEPVSLSSGRALPPPGHPDRFHAMVPYLDLPRARAASGTASIRVDGEARGTLDLSTGGSISLVVPTGAEVTLTGGAGAVVERGLPPRSEGVARSVVRPGTPGIGLTGATSTVPTEAECGAFESPCRIRVGDALQVPGFEATPGAHCGAGLKCGYDTVEGISNGLFVVSGYRSTNAHGHRATHDLWVEVGADSPHPWTREASLQMAILYDSAHLDPLPFLAGFDHFDDWPESDRARAMTLRWKHRKDPEPAALVALFEDLRDANPHASLTIDEVGEVAAAYRAIGNPARALEVWRAALGVAFLAEAAPLRQLEKWMGTLTSLQALVALPQYFPDLDVVQEAEFHLPEQLAGMAEQPLPGELLEKGVTPTDIRLLAAAWDRRFLAFHPNSPRADEVGFHLAKGLLDLNAPDAAAKQARASADRFPDSPVLDALVGTEAVARTHLGDVRSARALYEHLAEGTDWPLEDGTRGPALLRDDARFALARLDEATGRIDAAVDAYRSVSEQYPDAAHAVEALERVHLDVPTTLALAPAAPVVLETLSANVDTVYVRAYRVDLRTAFLRDGGLDGVHSLKVDGVSPEWSGQRRLASGPYTTRTSLNLPLRGVGAWLVQVDAEGARDTTLVVRSPLTVDVLDGSAGRRVTVHRQGRPAAGVDVRAWQGGGAEAFRTDIRGVVHVPAGAPVLAFNGEAVAFSPTSSSDIKGKVPPPAPAPKVDPLEERARRQRQKNAVQFDSVYQSEEVESLDASMF